MIFDDEKRKKHEPDEFDRIVKEMKKVIEDSFKKAFNSRPFVTEFSLQMDEKEHVHTKELYTQVTHEDITEDDTHIYVTLELPKTHEHDIKLKLRKDILEIKTKDDTKHIKLPVKVTKKITTSFINGILDIVLTKTHIS